MTPKHTPATWSLLRDVVRGRPRCLIVDAEGNEIASVNPYRESCNRDAELIAAAPDLLSAINRDPIEINGRIWTYDPATSTHRPTDAKAASDRPAGQAADMELPSRSESLGESKGAAPPARANITIVSYRTRLADADGISAKAVIDGLVNCGVFKDDTTKEIAEVRYRQIKVKNQADEKTEIIIEEEIQ